MGLISRLRRITRGRIEAFLDAIEDPAAVLPLLIDELAAQVTAAANAEAKALTAVKSLQRRLDETTGRAMRMHQAAQLALAAGNEQLARQAIALGLGAEKEQAAAQQRVDTAAKAHAEARDVRRQLGNELQSLRARKQELIASARQARQTQRPELDPSRLARSGRSLLDEVARMQEKIVLAEDSAQAQGEVAGLVREELSAAQLEELLRNQEIQRRLDELKKDVPR